MSLSEIAVIYRHVLGIGYQVPELPNRELVRSEL